LSVFITEPGANRDERHGGAQGQPDIHEEHEEDEDFEGVMETVAEALPAAEREAGAFQAAKEGEEAPTTHATNVARQMGADATNAMLFYRTLPMELVQAEQERLQWNNADNGWGRRRLKQAVLALPRWKGGS
jgi:hypothetical protein